MPPDEPTKPDTPTSAAGAAPETPDSPTFAELLAKGRQPLPAEPPAETPPPEGIPPADSGLLPATDKTAEELAAAQARIKNTQRWGHARAEEAKTLRSTLSTIFTDPDLGPAASELTGIPPTGVKAKIDEIKKSYSDAMNRPEGGGSEPLDVLIEGVLGLARETVLPEMEARTVTKQNQARDQYSDRLTKAAISSIVADTAPDVPVDFFWAISRRDEIGAETPVELRGEDKRAERLVWQTGRTIDLCREILDARDTRLETTRVQQERLTRQAGVIMPGGGAAPAPRPAEPGKPKTMVEQMLAARGARRVPA